VEQVLDPSLQAVRELEEMLQRIELIARERAPVGVTGLDSVGRCGRGPVMRAKGSPFTYIVKSAVTVSGDTTMVTVPCALTVSVPRVTLKSIVSVALFASGVVTVSCSTTLTTGLSRPQVTSI